MKKLTKLFALILTLVSLFVFTSCQDNNDGDKTPSDADVIITVSAEEYDIQDKTLKDYMDYLVTDGVLEFEMNGTMIKAVNGVENTTNSFWMIYTDDMENADSTWGTYEVNGKTYSSAKLGISELPIKDGCTYVLTYQKF